MGKKNQKTEWTKEDIRAWLGTHMGEYLLQRIEARKKIEANKHEDNKTYLTTLRKAREIAEPYGLDPEWVIETQGALMAALKRDVKAGSVVIASDEDYIEILTEAEPKVQALIQSIATHAKQKSEKEE